MEISHLPVHDTRVNSPPSAAVRLTRSQLAKKAELEAEPKSLMDGIGQMPQERETEQGSGQLNGQQTIKTDGNPTIQTMEPPDDMVPSDAMTRLPLDAPASPLPTAMPNVIQNLRADTPAKRSTSNKENLDPETALSTSQMSLAAYDMLEDAAVAAATPPRSEQSAARPEDQIAALDRLDDALENVSKDIPEVQSSPEKPKAKSESKERVRKETKKAAPVVRTTKAAQARISMAHAPKDAANRTPSLGRARPSAPLGRTSSVKQGPAATSETTTKRITSASSNKDTKLAAEREKKEAVIPHSKPRPISLFFPAPPPPPKSTKAPTQSTFQLPGEAVAAKLKVAREARQQKEAEDEEKRKAFKARPVPASLKTAPSVRQTNASKARESVMNGRDLKASTLSASTGPHKRASSVAAIRPAAPKPRVVSKDVPKAADRRPSVAPLTVKKRPSTAMALMSKPRPSVARTGSANSSQRAPSNPTKSTSKSKEVFNRAAVAKANAEKEKVEKEAAAKKARADAAERGRLASREWADKQKQKKLAAKSGVPSNEVTKKTEDGTQQSAISTLAVNSPAVTA